MCSQWQLLCTRVGWELLSGMSADMRLKTIWYGESRDLDLCVKATCWYQGWRLAAVHDTCCGVPQLLEVRHRCHPVLVTMSVNTENLARWPWPRGPGACRWMLVVEILETESRRQIQVWISISNSLPCHSCCQQVIVQLLLRVIWPGCKSTSSIQALLVPFMTHR
jgi:hypothetical protein